LNVEERISRRTLPVDALFALVVRDLPTQARPGTKTGKMCVHPVNAFHIWVCMLSPSLLRPA
jgi:hypothetical protein